MLIAAVVLCIQPDLALLTAFGVAALPILWKHRQEGVWAALSLLMLAWTLIDWILGNTVSGWASLMCSIWMIGGIQLLALGVIGEYIGKLYSESKSRPRFIIERVLNQEDND